jgi:hypothetical protein
MHRQSLPRLVQRCAVSGTKRQTENALRTCAGWQSLERRDSPTAKTGINSGGPGNEAPMRRTGEGAMDPVPGVGISSRLPLAEGRAVAVRHSLPE